MKLLTKARQLVLPLAFVSVGVFAYFQANAAPSDEECAEIAVEYVESVNLDVATVPGLWIWQMTYNWCRGIQPINN